MKFIAPQEAWNLAKAICKAVGLPENLPMRRLTLHIGIDEVPTINIETLATDTGETIEQTFQLRAMPIDDKANAVPAGDEPGGAKSYQRGDD